MLPKSESSETSEVTTWTDIKDHIEEYYKIN